MAGVCVPLVSQAGIEPTISGAFARMGDRTPLAHISAGGTSGGLVCPNCHALLPSALPPCSPYGGAVFPAVRIPNPSGGRGEIRTRSCACAWRCTFRIAHLSARDPAP